MNRFVVDAGVAEGDNDAAPTATPAEAQTVSRLRPLH
jgi:hypothetical protein